MKVAQPGVEVEEAQSTQPWRVAIASSVKAQLVIMISASPLSSLRRPGVIPADEFA